MANGYKRQTPVQEATPAAAPQEQEEAHGSPPDYRVVQANTDKDGNKVFASVGGIWKQPPSANGNEYLVLKIGALKLLVFPNNKK